MKKLFLFLFLIFFAGQTASALMLPVSLGELAKDSDLIIFGDVSSVQSKLEQDGEAWMITTTTQIAVTKSIKGAPSSIISLVLKGGTVGEKSVSVEHTPSLKEDESVILFLKWFEDGWYPLYGEAGKFTIKNGTVLPNFALKESMKVGEFEKKVRALIEAAGTPILTTGKQASSANSPADLPAKASAKAGATKTKGISGCSLIGGILD